MTTAETPTSSMAVGAPRVGAPAAYATASSAKDNFARELADVNRVSFSAHAQRRLASRNVQLNQRQLEGIARATDQAAAKGSRDSLLLMDDMALVINVRNRTVVTALDPSRMRNGIVTNIDAMVFVSAETT